MPRGEFQPFLGVKPGTAERLSRRRQGGAPGSSPGLYRAGPASSTVDRARGTAHHQELIAVSEGGNGDITLVTVAQAAGRSEVTRRRQRRRQGCRCGPPLPIPRGGRCSRRRSPASAIRRSSPRRPLRPRVRAVGGTAWLRRPRRPSRRDRCRSGEREGGEPQRHREVEGDGGPCQGPQSAPRAARVPPHSGTETAVGERELRAFAARA